MKFAYQTTLIQHCRPECLLGTMATRGMYAGWGHLSSHAENMPFCEKSVAPESAATSFSIGGDLARKTTGHPIHAVKLAFGVSTGCSLSTAFRVLSLKRSPATVWSARPLWQHFIHGWGAAAEYVEHAPCREGEEWGFNDQAKSASVNWLQYSCVLIFFSSCELANLSRELVVVSVPLLFTFRVTFPTNAFANKQENFHQGIPRAPRLVCVSVFESGLSMWRVSLGRIPSRSD